MKRSIALLSMGMIGAIAAIENKDFPITERGTVGKKSNPPIKKPRITPFNKQEGIVKTIAEYKLIQAGESKQGLRKQCRTLKKVKEWLDQKLLTQTDLE